MNKRNYSSNSTINISIRSVIIILIIMSINGTIENPLINHGGRIIITMNTWRHINRTCQKSRSGHN